MWLILAAEEQIGGTLWYVTTPDQQTSTRWCHQSKAAAVTTPACSLEHCRHLWNAEEDAGPEIPQHHKLKTKMDNTALHFTVFSLLSLGNSHQGMIQWKEKPPSIIHFVLIWIAPFSHSQGEPSVPKSSFFSLASVFLCNWNAEQKAHSSCLSCSIRWH